MDDLKKRRLKNEIIDQLKKQGYDPDIYDFLIGIYVDMLLEKEVLEQLIADHAEPQVNQVILIEVLKTLDEDIVSYKKRLCLE